MQRLLRAVLTLIFLTTATLLAASCGPGYKPGERARISLSQSFPHGKSMTVLLLPAEVEGKPGVSQDQSLTTAFSQRLLDLGYRVIDWNQAKARAQAAGLTLRSESDADIMLLAKSLNITVVGKGRITYGYSPARSESKMQIETITRREIRNGTHRKDTVTISEEIPTTRSYSNGESYYPLSQSLNLVSVESGELLLAASVLASSDYDMTDELAHGIHRATR
jgi:hypothetical protein